MLSRYSLAHATVAPMASWRIDSIHFCAHRRAFVMSLRLSTAVVSSAFTPCIVPTPGLRLRQRRITTHRNTCAVVTTESAVKVRGQSFRAEDFFLVSIACLIPSVRRFHYPTPYLTNYCTHVESCLSLSLPITTNFYYKLFGRPSPPPIYLPYRDLLSPRLGYTLSESTVQSSRRPCRWAITLLLLLQR